MSRLRDRSTALPNIRHRWDLRMWCCRLGDDLRASPAPRRRRGLLKAATGGYATRRQHSEGQRILAGAPFWLRRWRLRYRPSGRFAIRAAARSPVQLARSCRAAPPKPRRPGNGGAPGPGGMVGAPAALRCPAARGGSCRHAGGCSSGTRRRRSRAPEEASQRATAAFRVPAPGAGRRRCSPGWRRSWSRRCGRGRCVCRRLVLAARAGRQRGAPF
jgi:hypothetical protein